jgi:hypothetical protein
MLYIYIYIYIYNPQDFLGINFFEFIIMVLINNLTNIDTHIIIDIYLKCYTFYFVYRDDQILFNGTLFYIGYMTIPQAYKLPLWRTNGVVMTILLHAGPVEFLYYWFHRALHHHYLYSRYHSHHHSSIVTEPITCKIIALCLYSLKDKVESLES